MELAARAVPFDARPVIEALQRQVDVFIGLEFHHSQPALAGNASTSIMARSDAENASPSIARRL
jgi:hypothetical protein